jgi:hypothetical protein
MIVKKYNQSFLLLIGFLFLAGCEKKEEPEAQFTDMKSFIEFKCSICHFSSRIYKEPRTEKFWINLLGRHRRINPQLLNNEDAEKILEYLLVNNSISEGEKKAGEDKKFSGED